MRYTVNKDEYEALSEAMQAEYTLDGDTATLTVEGDPHQAALEKSESKRKLEAEHTKNAERKLADADAAREQMQKDLDSAGNNKGEIDKVRADFAVQLDKLKEEREAESAQMKADRNHSLIMETANKLANEHFTVPGLIAPEIAKRLTVIEAEGRQAIKALTADGKESLSNVSEMFQKDFLDNKDMSTIIKAKVGNGGGASSNNGGGASGKTSLKDMTATEEAVYANEHPEEYAALLPS